MTPDGKRRGRRKRSPRQGLFNGHWLDMAGRQIGRIRREEYGELYRLHRIGQELGLHRAPGEKAPPPPYRRSTAAPSRERPGTMEANPFH